MKKLTSSEKGKALEIHVKYELRMLIGARELTILFDEYKLGNASSITRDSIYEHARLLYEFFSKTGEQYINIGMYGGNQVSVFTNDVVQALNNHAIHITANRIHSNTNTIELPFIAISLANKIVNAWQNWIDYAPPGLKTKLKLILKKAEEEADNDVKILLKSLKA